MAGNELNNYALEIAQTRLSSTDPYVAIHAARALTTGELPDPTWVENTVKRIEPQMKDASRQGQDPNEILGSAILKIYKSDGR